MSGPPLVKVLAQNPAWVSSLASQKAMWDTPSAILRGFQRSPALKLMQDGVVTDLLATNWSVRTRSSMDTMARNLAAAAGPTVPGGAMPAGIMGDAAEEVPADVEEPVEDAPGYDLRPDPLRAETPAELVEALRDYRAWSGDPSLRVMAKRCQHQVAHSTMGNALGSSDLPRLEVVQAILIGCQAPEEYRSLFATAWRKIRMGGQDRPAGVLRVVRDAGTG